MNIKAHTSIIGETGYNNHSRNFFTAINKFHTVKIRNFTVGKSWKGNNKTPHEGEKYLSKEHKEMLYEQILWVKDSERGNFPIYSFDESFVPDINITLEPMNHHLFYDNHKGYNVGYNVWETTEYPQSFFNLIHKYDQFWVPTKWQKDNLVKQGYPQDRIKIVPGGIDPEVFKPAAKKPADKFRFILFGKWEYRKSTQEILSCFLEVFKDSEDVELIASIDNAHKGEKGQAIKEKLKDLGLKSDKIKLLHFPPASEYLDYLQQGDVFISCARSEGWNLPLIEAMACGVPSIYSKWGAQLEFSEGRGLPVEIKGEIPAIDDDGSILPGNYCEPDWEDFKRVLLSSYKEHKALKEKALKDSDEIRRIFTWENAAKIASQHLTKSHFNFESFFSKYKTHIDKKSVCRSKFYEYVIPKLIELGRPIYVLETGTMSTSLEDNSGAFTLIMADLIKNYTGGKIYTVDLSKENIQKCKNLTKEFEEVIEYASVDSIEFIKSLDKDTVKKFDLVYLDSYDLWLPDTHNSAQHHLNELLSLFDNINDTCFIGIDDNYLPGSWVLWNHLDGKGDIIKQEKIVIKDNVVGKGQYCESFLIKNGWIRNKSINLVGGNNVFLYEKTDIGDSDTKDKILYISPHLSTGGLPQYLLKKIESLVQYHEIVCVEYSNISTMFTIQKIGIKNILGDKLITLGDRKEQLIEIINTFKPDVIHLEEIPEYFMRSDISDFIYSSSRSYKIIETSHDSSFETERKIYLPDKFLLVSRYQLEKFSKLGVPCELMEYPIEYKPNLNKGEAQKRLGLSPDEKHVINVGLFTSRKNQAEIIEYARKMLDQPIQFHFIGNQADNFKWYWEPLMKDFPSNCKWWGERNDVDVFYEAADLFLFTSRGTNNDKETSPLVIREAISYRTPSLIYNLPVYMNMYDQFENVEYLDFDNLDVNKNKILNKVGLVSVTLGKEDYVFIVSTYPNDSSVSKITSECLDNLKKFNYPIIIASHCPVSVELQKKADYCIYDANNLLVKHDFYCHAWSEFGGYRVDLNLKNNNNDSYHGPAVYLNYYNSINFAHKLGYKKAICLNFDFVIKDPLFIKRIIDKISGKSGYFCHEKKQEGETLVTAFHVIDTKFFIDSFPSIKTEGDYFGWEKRINSESNGLENMYYHTLKCCLGDLHLASLAEYKEDTSKCEIDSNFQIEYFSILPIKDQPSKVGIYFQSSNNLDNRFLTIKFKGKEVKRKIESSTRVLEITDFNNEAFDVKLEVRDKDENGSVIYEKIITIDSEYFNNISKNGLVTLKN